MIPSTANQFIVIVILSSSAFVSGAQANETTIATLINSTIYHQKLITTNETAEISGTDNPFGTQKPDEFNNNSLKVPEESPKSDTTPLWKDIMNYVQITCAVIGFMANSVVLFTLYREKGVFSEILLFLLKHQSICDGLVCLLLVVFQVPPFGWKTHAWWLDFFLCHFWHSQGLFWMFVALSVWNLVLITGERYLAVCKPLFFMR